ncbi:MULTISPECIES: ester cyclase [unclassified Haladaptatus]|uniref:ester cyclase n=1 Tax=unclassified Haladaptatus TaxID=2622732 RepID=UPI00209BDF5A|nr:MULTISPECIES: ester cyclase [unclassified Haladaptatus]MCO8245928.1 ester cyclase [Haladaptatus sp. AB643]MCO8254452.1 ester cyclase [Haladaptatus sp. AB618]
MTSANEHEDRVHRLYEGVWNGENPDIATELVHPEYVIHDRDLAEELRGPELYTALADSTREIFPDMSFTIEDSFAVEDKVAVRWTMVGTQDGAMVGIEPTGTAVTLRAIEIDRFEDGRLIETWTQSDMLSLMEQLDAV